MVGGNIFISYRRGQDSNAAGRLHDRLERSFDKDQLFFDVDAIPLGVDFAEYIDKKVGQCRVQLVLIGQGWLTKVERLQDPDDFVRVEIEAALRRSDVPVIPVLLDGANMPSREILPESLHPLVRRHAISLTHTEFSATVDGRLRSELVALLQNGGPDTKMTSVPVEPQAADRDVVPSQAASHATNTNEAVEQSQKPEALPVQTDVLPPNQTASHRSANTSVQGPARRKLKFLVKLIAGLILVGTLGFGAFALQRIPAILIPPSGDKMQKVGEDLCVNASGRFGRTQTLSNHPMKSCFQSCLDSWSCYGVTTLFDSKNTCYLHQEPISGVLDTERNGVVGYCYARTD